MLVTLLLLAVLTLGAVSATDDIASDDLAVSDEGDAVDVSQEDNSDGIASDGNSENYDPDDGVIISVDENEFELDNEYDLEETFASVSVREGLEGNITITAYDDNGNEISFFNKNLNDMSHQDDYDYEGFIFYPMSLKDLGDYNQFVNFEGFKLAFVNNEGVEVDFREYEIDYDDEYNTVEFVKVDEDVKDGVVIWVDTDEEFELDDDDCMQETFTVVSIRDDLEGNIVIASYDNEGHASFFFNKDLQDIDDSEEDMNHDGFTCYYISLAELTNLEGFLNSGRFTVAFVTDDNQKVDSREYDIEYNAEDKTVEFSEVDDDDDDDDEEYDPIEVKDIIFDEPDEPFVVIHFKDKSLIFKIEVNNLVIYDENMAESERVIEDDGIYSFNVSYNILNEYIFDYVVGAKNLTDLIDNGEINNGDIVDFYIGDDCYKYVITTEVPEGDAILFDKYIPYKLEFPNLDIIMKDNWNETIVLDIIIEDFSDPYVVIYLDATDVFTTHLSYPEDDSTPEGYRVYHFRLEQFEFDWEEGEYEVGVEFYKDLEHKDLIWDNSDEPPLLKVYEPQIDGDENVTIEIVPTETRLTEDNDTLIIISTADASGDVTVSIEGHGNPINLPLASCRHEGNDYFIGSKDLNLGVAGTYMLNVAYGNVNLEGTVRLTSNLEIWIRDSDEVIYTGDYSDDGPFVEFRLADDEINEKEVNGTVRVYISLDGETPKLCFEGDLKDLEFNGRSRAKFIPISDLNIPSNLNGTYLAEVRYLGGSEAAIYVSSEVVFKILDADDFEVEITKDEVIISGLPVDSGTIIITTDGVSKNYTVDDLNDYYWDDDSHEYCIALDDGANKVSVAYKFENSDKVIEIAGTVLNPIDPALTISVADITEGETAVVVITTNATFSGNVLIQIAGSNYTVEVVNGKGSLPVSGLAVGNYTAVATFRAVDIFDSSTKSTNFAVKAKTPTVIKATAVTTTYATSKNIVVTLTDANGNALEGKQVTVVLNGAAKTLATNTKGQVSLATPANLVPGTYSASITFNGDAKYVKSTGSAKVVVKKAKAKFSAKNKKFKRTLKVKKYSVVLKSDKGKAIKKVKVFLKVKGKKYTAKTNNKGKAVFKIKKLTKKGTFKSTLTFKGNKYYNKLTKKVKIILK